MSQYVYLLHCTAGHFGDMVLINHTAELKNITADIIEDKRET
jgi:hypothetical protein